jgi:cytochrome P450
MEPWPDAETWAACNVRHFRRLLYAATALFVATEITALLGVVPHLRPVSLHDITANILFAIGFGCPLVLHLSSLPRLRELIVTVAIGAALALCFWKVHHAIGLPEGYKPEEVAVAQAIAGLGLASLGAMALRAWRGVGRDRAAALAFLLPACVALMITMEAGIFLYFIKEICPSGRDPSAYAIDAAYGMQWSFAVGRFFAEYPLIRFVCYAIYVAPPPALVFVYALQTRAQRPPPVDAATVLLAVFVTGYSLYFVFPVYGPAFAFPDAFPNSPPPLDGLLGTRLRVYGADAWPNGMPSLHTASVVLAYWQARPYGRWAGAAAAVFLIGTLVATLGQGEHYLVDLVVAIPLSLAVYAACMPSRGTYDRQRRAALSGGILMLAGWYALLFLGVELLLGSPVLAWLISLGTTAAVLWLEWRLYRAAVPDPVGLQSRLGIAHPAPPTSEVLKPTDAFATTIVPEPPITGISVSPAKAPAKVAPGPRGHFLIGNLIAFRRDVLGLLRDSQREFGDVVRFRLGPMLIHMVAHPDHIKQVLVTHQHRYNKDTRSSSKIAGITGEGLLTSNGGTWLRQRRLMQPVFNPQRLAACTGLMIEATNRMLDDWQIRAAAGQAVDVASEMTRLTCTIVARVLLGADVSADIAEVEWATTTVMEHTWRRLERIIYPPLWLPTPLNLRFRCAKRRLDEIVYRLIAERRSGAAKDDLLALLLKARDDSIGDVGEGMTEEQLHNETVTLLLAGHETTANALSWTLYLLAQHPRWRQEAYDEVVGVLGRPTSDTTVLAAETLQRLDLVTRVFQEAMRLYPPIWIMERRVLEDDVIGGYHIPAGSSLEISPYVTHRHPEFWESPERFDPNRFTNPRSAGRPQYAYLPFGGGQRLCIGSHLAMLEARVIVSRVLQRFRLELVQGRTVQPLPGITLRLRHGLLMTVHPADLSQSAS